MQTIEIETTQNVKIDYPVASIGERVVASIIDALIVIGYIILVFITYFAALDAFGSSEYFFSIAFFIFLFLPAFFYHLLCEIFLNGQSFGKKIMKLRVVKTDGSQAGIGSYFLRWILRPIDIDFTYGAVALVTLLINGKGQRLGDIAAGTTVIKLKTETKLEDTVLYRTPTGYTIKYPQVSSLSDKDIRVIKEVLDLRYRRMDNIAYEKVLFKAKETIEKKLGVNTTLTAVDFLEVILKDYNFLHTAE